MSLARVDTFAIDGVEARRVWVEADIRRGLSAFAVVGLADKAVREARERVRAALVNSGFVFPQERITVNLAPAYLRKVGPGFDLPLAVAILAASGQLPADAVAGCAVVGELSLTGEVRAVRGALAVAEGVRRHRLDRLLLPRGRAREAALVPEVEVLGVEHLQEAVEVLRGEREPRAGARLRAGRARSARGARPQRRARPQRADPGARGRRRGRPQPVPARPARDRQDDARAAAAVAAAADDAARGDRGHAAALDRRPARRRAGAAAPVPLAASHDLGLRASSAAAACPTPGEATLAHHGVLFLDELSEFTRPGARGAAPAARGRPRDGRARAARDGLPDARDARRRVQPVPVRDGGDRLPLLGRRPGAPPAAAQRPAARPHRRLGHGRPAVGRRAAQPVGAAARRACASGSSPRASARPPGWRATA